jgi:hypothetical protein
VIVVTITEQDIEHYRVSGWIVLHRIIPPTLIHDLRREADIARDVARRTDPNAQRLQPIAQHPELNPRRFQDLCELPELVSAMKQLVAPDAWITGPSRMGILLEPSERPWATQWHRDYGPFQVRVDKDEFRKLQNDPRYFHQINCPLYAESCTWYVPGSHLRNDTPQEVHLTRDFPWQIGSDQTGKSVEELEHYCAAYVRSMPGAIQFSLDAGDLALYRNHGYHVGNYVPYQRRATLHDNVWTPPFKASTERWAIGEQYTLTTDEMLVAAPVSLT